VLSRGLTSRIVQYHDNSTRRLNRSLSGTEAYNKPGQFPIVHLKTKEHIYKPPKNQNLSMVRIPPPERSVFQGSIVPSVNQSNSNPTAKYLNGTIHENQPILHPHHSNADLQPTRSVLEDLKAISRKRINNDELDAREISKKYKEVDDQNVSAAVLASVSSSLPEPPTSQTTKRQREIQNSPQSSGTSTLELSPSEKQVVKKRLYTKNNEILSSLSSSLVLLSPKRRNFDEKFLNEAIAQNKKEPKNDNRIVLPKLTDVDTWSMPEEEEPVIDKTCSEPNKQKNIIDNTETKSRPKITLFNKNYDECEVRKIPFENENAGKIQFIKPKKLSSLPNKSCYKEKAEQLKLEMMLKGLSGELNEKDEETVDSKTQVTIATSLPTPSKATSVT
uniref:Uncharacterized protein n=1 Tax=Megaselia scalaris TaxID=36166 RepID=T1GDR9_MEGSC